jgi:hypothetical protein
MWLRGGISATPVPARKPAIRARVVPVQEGGNHGSSASFALTGPGQGSAAGERMPRQLIGSSSIIGWRLDLPRLHSGAHRARASAPTAITCDVAVEGSLATWHPRILHVLGQPESL